jgi:ketosteroid isomerase-like protein
MIRSRSRWLLLPTLIVAFACAEDDRAEMAQEVQEKAEVAAKTMETMVQAKDEWTEEAMAATDLIQAEYIAAYNAENGAGIAALFDSDGTIAPPEMASITQGGIAAYYDAQFASGADFSLTVDRESMFVSGDMSVAWGTYVATMAMEGAETVTVDGRYGSISKRQADGSWKIYRHMFNYINPPPEM